MNNNTSTPDQKPQSRVGGRLRQFLKANLWISIGLLVAAIVLDSVVSKQAKGAYSAALTTSQFAAWLGLVLSCLSQFILGLVALFLRGSRNLGALAFVAAPVTWGTWLISLLFTTPGAFLGGAWGRPLRLNGRQLHSQLREGSDWTRGKQPDCGNLDGPTRRALEGLWLHDAQKEHASIPAFARISWMLAAVGAPAELVEWSHRAALQEIEHTRLCFALAAGYGGRTHSVQPMPELLLGGLDLKGDPMAVLTAESLTDGCQLEDFNADVAQACAQACNEPVTRIVLEQIAREERSHAEFSWALLEWLMTRGDSVHRVLEQTLRTLDNYPRPTAVVADKLLLVAQADAGQLLRHGRLPDSRWRQLWDARLIATRQRVHRLLEQPIVA